MKDTREQMIGQEFYHNGEKVKVTHLDDNEKLVIVTQDFLGFYSVEVSELVKLTNGKPFCLDTLKDGQNVVFIANETTYLLSWDGKPTNKRLMTKDKIYNGIVKKDQFGFMVIEYTNDIGRVGDMTFDYAEGKIDLLEES